MNRYWVSWWSGYYEDEGCTKPPFQLWISGQKERYGQEDVSDDEVKDDCSICAMIDAENEEEIWESVEKHFPDYEQRFCEKVEDDAMSGNRFPGFENKTSLKG